MITEAVFPYRPNLAQPIVERLEWLTDVFESRNGTEERIALRSFPRRSLEYNILTQGNAAARLDGVLWGHQAKRVVLPIWTDRVDTTVNIPAGSSFVEIETGDAEFTEGGIAVLWQNAETVEAVEIFSVEVNGLVLVGLTTKTFPAGSRVYPALYARMPEEISVNRVTNNAAQSSVRFEIENRAIPPQSDATIYRAQEVNLRRPNWVQGIREPHRRRVERLDYVLGAIFVDDLSGVPVVRQTHSYMLKTRSDTLAFRKWLYARAGRLNSFWQPQASIAMHLSSGVTSGATTFSVKKLNAVSNYEMNIGRRDLAIRHRPSGTVFFARVLSKVAGAGETDVFTIDTAFPFSGSSDDIVSNWLMVSRFEADAIDIAWQNNSVAVCNIDIRSIRV